MRSQVLLQITPVAISIAVIVVVACLQSRSETLAAITATMPVTVPLSFWIVYAGSGGDRASVTAFTEQLFITMLANVFFVGAVWLAARANWRLVPTLVAGYGVWGLVLVLLMMLRWLARR